MLLSALALLGSRYEVRRILQQFPHGIRAFDRTAFIEVIAISSVRYLVAWTVSCLSFGAISAAVEQVDSGLGFSFIEAVQALFEPIGRVLRVSLLLFGLVTVVDLAATLISDAVYWGPVRHLEVNAVTLLTPLTYLLWGVSILAISRFGLAIPAVILDDYTVSKAMFRSDELTEGKWLILAVLIFKAVGGGYIAARLPFWLVHWIRESIPLPAWAGWAAWITSVVAITVVEPTLFIGFTLLYLRESARCLGDRQAQAEAVTT